MSADRTSDPSVETSDVERSLDACRRTTPVRTTDVPEAVQRWGEVFSIVDGGPRYEEHGDLEVSLRATDDCRTARGFVDRLRHVDGTSHLVAWERLSAGTAEALVAVAHQKRWTLVRVAASFTAESGAIDGPHRRTPEVPGISVAIYGVDGSGKSTLISALPTAMAAGYPAVERWHLTTYQRPGATKPPVTDPHGRSRRSIGASIAKVALYLAKAWLIRTPRLREQRRAGRLVLVDRDLADYRLDPVRYRLGGPGWLHGLVERLGPRPDLALVLEIDAPTVIARSREVSPEALEGLIERYRTFARKRPYARTLDAARPADDVAFEAAGAIYAHLEARLTRGPSPVDGIARSRRRSGRVVVERGDP